MSSLTSNAVSSVAAGASLFFLAHGLVALRTASQLCGSEKEHLSPLPYLEYYYSVYDVTNCHQAGVSLTVSPFRLTTLSCGISLSPLHNLAYSGVPPSPVDLNAWRQTASEK